MTTSSREMTRQWAWSLYAWLATLEGIIALDALLRIPGETSSAWLLGLSKARLTLAVSLLFWTACFTALGVFARRDRVVGALNAWLARPWRYTAALVFSLGIFLVGTQFLHLGYVVTDPYVRGYLTRLSPLLLLAVLFAFQNLLLLPWLRHGWPGGRARRLLLLSLVLFAVLLLLWGAMALTGLGLIPDQIGWDPPGTPILLLQVAVAVFVGALVLLLDALGVHPRDALIALLIWGAAVWLWGGQPMQPDYFSPAPRPPNFEFYPYSDAATHDVLAQRLLIGAGFPGVARKPLYAVFLAGLHLLAGQDYQRIAFLQVMVLALLPVALYFLGGRLHHRASGVIAAALILLRERNAIALSGQIGVSHAKLLMSDLPATLGVAVLTLLLVRWLDAPQRRPRAPLVLGGVLGLLLLLRPQMSVLAAAVTLLAALWFWRQPRRAALNVALILLGLGLTLTPWLTRSYRLIGEFALNDPNQNAFLTELYTLTPGEAAVTRLPGESDGEFARRVDAYLSAFIRQHPDVVARFVAAHFAHSLAEMMVTLPMSPWVVSDGGSDLFPHWRTQGEKLWADCCSAATYVHAMPFWDDWRGTLPPGGAGMLAFNLFLVAAGLAVAWKRRGALGLVPLGVGLVYLGSTALGRYSGWRLILPADWALFFYYALGWGQALRWGLRYAVGPMSAKGHREHREPLGYTEKPLCSPCLRVRIWAIAALTLLLLGSLPVLAENIAPFRYVGAPPAEALARLETPAPSNDNMVILWGRALYPRFYPRGQGEPGGAWAAFAPREYPRLGFVLLGVNPINIVLPVDSSPDSFPHYSEVIILGCQEEDVVLASAVVLLGEGGYTTLRAAPNFSCDAVMP